MKRARQQHQAIFAIAREEIAKWPNVPKGIVMAILFCFIHRYLTGKTFEESFCRPAQPEADWQI